MTTRPVSFLAHVKDQKVLHVLAEHLRETAQQAAAFAGKFKAADWASILGLWHDLGKYTNDFQNYIRKSSGYECDQKLPIIGHPDKQHAIVGAIHLKRWLEGLKCSQKERDKYLGLIGLPIAAHHGGLADLDKFTDRLDAAERNRFIEKLEHNWDCIPEEIRTPPLPKGISKTIQKHLLTRMLFSCLVDADWLDTERFLKPELSASRQYPVQLADLLAEFNRYVANKQDLSSELGQQRDRVLQDCRQAAQRAPGIFSLTVPTGGGKTLSSMAFALEHAVNHRKDRIIYAIPYTSIIEQNAEVFRRAFGSGDGYHSPVLEHHCNFSWEQQDLEQEGEEAEPQSTYAAHLAIENWDWPVIVTTNVQLFESLFSHRRGKCRKLHNIANSVLVLDEAHLLPVHLLNPVLECLQELVKHYGVTVLLCSATMPVLQRTENFAGLEGVQEIVSDRENLYQILKGRVRLMSDAQVIAQPDTEDNSISWEQLADQIRAHGRSVLSIVNTKPDARALFEAISKDIPEGFRLFHLSTFMCPAHRRAHLETVRQSLQCGEKLLLVSTQLVEAGVDLDFPVVYRALAGLDSILQAAGRCNRENKLPYGELYLFRKVEGSSRLPPDIQSATDSCQETWRNLAALEPMSLEAFQRYYNSLIWKKGAGLDQHRICEHLADLRFRTVGEKFKLIDQPSVPLLVPHGEGQKFIEEVSTWSVPDFRTLRKLQPYTVSVYPDKFRAMQRDLGICSDHFQLVNYLPIHMSRAYSEQFGIDPHYDYQPSDLIL